MYSRREHAQRIVSTFGFDCDSCRAAIVRDINAPDVGAVVVGRRDDGLYRIAATTIAPAEYLREVSQTTKREHTLVHAIAVLDTRALEGHLQRRLDAFLDDRRQWYALTPEVVAAICSTRHICEVPSPYLTSSTANPGFSTFIRGLERAIGATVS